ncbi:hypothetical protein D9758_015190 [Tetrapyrgos nigripes]|uniref:Alpha/beta hydrolase fold-3 domain-containing protein n=1 Tax=Tetrapyrgos nigripes TaxID=182062 RepID=A0A8H5C0L0_9AGAR|nr:hypothetical protein D9758_015190 [Tetrapyrgos nigripes]
MQTDPSNAKQPITLVYKSITQADGLTNLPFKLDVYLPCGPLPLEELQQPATNNTSPSNGSSAVVYFHGGGLTVGNRKSWFPAWLQKRVNAAGHFFISADYRLIPLGLSTAHEVLEDIKDVFSFICSSEFEEALAKGLSSSDDGTTTPKSQLRIDPNRIAVAGTSSGGTCAYLAAKHVEPKPRVLLSLYAAGGDFFTSHWLSPKATVFFRGREMLDPSAYSTWVYPLSTEERSTIVSDSPNTYFPLDHPTTPGWPSNPRSKLAQLYLQLGNYLDYYTGQHEPSLSAALRGALHSAQAQAQSGSQSEIDANAKEFVDLIPERHRHLFPQLLVDSFWPPTFFYHGASDSAVPVQETRNMYDLVRKAKAAAASTHRRQAGADASAIGSLGSGPYNELDRQLDSETEAEVHLIIREGEEHSFDYAPDAEVKFKEDFDRMARFLYRYLRRG